FFMHGSSHAVGLRCLYLRQARPSRLSPSRVCSSSSLSSPPTLWLRVPPESNKARSASSSSSATASSSSDRGPDPPALSYSQSRARFISRSSPILLSLLCMLSKQSQLSHPSYKIFTRTHL
ncbi:unnamed protein product, partial [Mycena citricolor]